MFNDVHTGGLYLLMAAMLVAGSLIGRRTRLANALTMVLAWIVIFGAGFVMFTFRDDLAFVGARLKSEATGDPVLQGKQIRVPMAIDGHFWVEAEVNGVPVNFLIDSGASVTTLSKQAASAAGVSTNAGRDQLVRTGNGIIRVASGRADTLTVGPLKRRSVVMYIADQDDLNVLGMNVLSTLHRWGVEGRWLVMEI